MATHSSILVWRIPWTEEPHGLQSMGSQKSWTWLKWVSMHTAWLECRCVRRWGERRQEGQVRHRWPRPCVPHWGAQLMLWLLDSLLLCSLFSFDFCHLMWDNYLTTCDISFHVDFSGSEWASEVLLFYLLPLLRREPTWVEPPLWTHWYKLIHCFPIHHRYTCGPHPEPSSLPIPSLWVIPVH